MNWERFETQACGKWVLTGEHAVLRGSTAIALPLLDRALKLRFVPDRSGELHVTPASAAPIIQDLLQSIEDRWQESDRSFSWPGGSLEIESTIPMGAGMGSSAALSVALTRWMAEPLGIAPDGLFEFARQLEHRFHGQSSGMDIAVILAAQPIAFDLSRGTNHLRIRNLPRFSFHDTGVRARTSDCILKVQQLREESPKLAMRVDELMSSASRDALEGLMLYDASVLATGAEGAGSDHAIATAGNARALDLIAQAMRRAQECFYSWRLVPSEAHHLEQDLLDQGALAVKLTGAGGGGMLVALWSK